MDKLKLKALSVEKLAGTLNRQLTTSTRVNKFLEGDFTIPKQINDTEDWIKKQFSGVVNVNNIDEIVEEIVQRDVNAAVSKVTEELQALQLTDEQAAKVPDAILNYRKFLESVIAKSKRVKQIVHDRNKNLKTGEVKPAKVPVVKESNSKKEKVIEETES